MAKYDELGRVLRDRVGVRVEMTFDEIIAWVPGGLPTSSYRHTAWWSNEKDGQHVQARAWIDAGWSVERVDLRGRRVFFVRQQAPGEVTR